MVLPPREQRALLRIERSLRKDAAVSVALEAFSRTCCRGKGPVRECLSPWHPILWRVACLVLIAAVTVLLASGVIVAMAAG
jgi:hypothetical protein